MLRQQVSQLLSQGQFAEAELLCDRAISEGDESEAFLFKAVVRTQAGRFSEALPIFEEARKRMPKNPDVLYNFGSAYQQAGNLERALEMWRLAVIINPGDARALYNIAAALNCLGRASEAESAYRTLLSLDPTHGYGLLDLGGILFHKGDLATAAEALSRAVQVMPLETEAWLKLAATMRESRDLAAAETCLRQVLEIDPNCGPGHVALGTVLLQLGRWREGFAELQWQRYGQVSPLPDLPTWDGSSSLQGQRLLVWCDGDAAASLLFARYLPKLCSDAITLVGPAPLCGLLSQLPMVERAWPQGALLDASAFDRQLHLASLPFLLDEDGPGCAAAAAYLPAPASTAGADDRRRRIGLSWSGEATRRRVNTSDASLDALLPLLELGDAAFFSLQRVPAPQDAERLLNDPRISDRAARSADFRDVVASLADIDLLITTDNDTAHLAGSMGLPFCVLLPWVADWPWGLEGEKTPWYPSARLYRQSAPGDWGSAVRRLRDDLAAGRLPPAVGNRSGAAIAP